MSLPHLSVQPADIRVRDGLSDDLSDAGNAVLRIAVLLVAKVFTEADDKGRPLLGGSHRKELASL